jgi:hypothetical protein
MEKKFGHSRLVWTKLLHQIAEIIKLLDTTKGGGEGGGSRYTRTQWQYSKSRFETTLQTVPLVDELQF